MRRAAAQRSDGALVPGPGATAQILAWLADVTASSGSEGAAASFHEHDMLATPPDAGALDRTAQLDIALLGNLRLEHRSVQRGTEGA